MQPIIDKNNLSNKLSGAILSETDFKKISQFIYANYGINIEPKKKLLLQSRLHKRLRLLKISNFKDYIEYVFSKHGEEEITHMIDVVSTNKTDFFREPSHFDFLTNHILPEFIQSKPSKKTLNLWSAACSSGEEPYTIAIVLNEFITKNPAFNYSILATDICTSVLEKAKTAIYSEEKISEIPTILKKKYFLKSKENNKNVVQIVSNIREKVHFNRLNFMEKQYDVKEMFDIIFCRNVLMYFDFETKEKVINKLCKHLRQGGYFILGQTEIFASENVPLQPIISTIFQKV